ncbi:putative peptidoglycan lipid II flippase [Sporobacter termitidis DSM 10068]|uniref:Probable lipid II flippase MurJ n=1 Tax=Sporobacter termitidis DSM 10068 TaxID=1123282 RepID=A0A1M5WXT5_9FIRM|nr:murein biosynthesis integral membrane protein MurJ [Sporobacter termitidis]SHH92172.1 putative peptidoglycan lipid II flippase [Sporobacter termitidis DSM 10068]
MAEKNKNPVKTISLVMVLTLVGKILGLLRDRLMTVHYGSGMETNAFLTASQIPRVFFDAVFASAVAASFIPVFSEYVAKKGRREALDFSGNFITVISFLSLLLTVLGIVFTGPLVSLFAPGYDAQTAALCVSLTRVMFPTVLFTGIAYCFVGILQSFDEFNIPALISVIANLVVILYYYTFNPKYGIYGLACAFLIGWFVQAAMQVPSLIRKGFHYKPSLRMNSEGMKKVFALMIPVMVSTWVQPINLTINTRFGSHLYNGTGVTAINLSNNLYLIIIGVFILSVTNVIFPRLSRLTAENKAAQFRDTISTTVHASMYFVVPMTAGLMVLARPIISLIYGGGQFDAFSVSITSQALTFASLGMIGYALQAVLCRAYFARQNGRVPLVAGLASIAVNIVLCILLTDTLGVKGLAIASAAAGTVNAIVLMIPLEVRKEGFLDRKFSLDFLKMVVATLVMAAVVWVLMRALDGLHPGKLWEAVTAAVPAAAGFIVYFAATSLAGLDEARTAAGIIKKRLRRSSDDSTRKG